MGIINTGLQRVRNKQNELHKQGLPSGMFHLLGVIASGIWRMALAKWYLRKCKSVGKLVSIKGKPHIMAKGDITIGDEVRIWSVFNKAKIFVNKGAKLTIGKNSRINGAHISVSNYLEIQDNVRIAPYTIIVDSDFHKVDDHFSDEGVNKPIIIEEGAWITMNCMIMKGVRIGRGSVVAAGAVVTKDVPPYTVVGGVPAKVIKHLNENR